MGAPIDMTGKKFGKLTVIRKDHSETGRVFWECKCDCGNTCVVSAVKLRNMKQTSCGCDTSMNKKNKCSVLDMKPGMRFGELTLLEPDDKCKDKYKHWFCYCNCGNIKSIRANNIVSGNTTTCGHKNKNTYNLSGEYGIGYTSNTHHEFYFDLEDYDKIKSYTWFEIKRHNENLVELRAKIKGTQDYIEMQNLILGKSDKERFIDHINRNRLDNRKSNLRLVTPAENSCNTNRNTSGYIGVAIDTRTGKWKAQISHAGKCKCLGLYDNLEDAIRARRDAEYEIHGSYISEMLYTASDAS